MKSLDTLISQVPTDCTYCKDAFSNDPWYIAKFGGEDNVTLANLWERTGPEIKKTDIKYALKNEPENLKNFLLASTPCSLCPLLDSGECEPHVLIKNYDDGAIEFFVAPDLNPYAKKQKGKGITAFLKGLFEKQESRGEFSIRLEKQILTVAADNLDTAILRPIHATFVG